MRSVLWYFQFPSFLREMGSSLCSSIMQVELVCVFARAFSVSARIVTSTDDTIQHLKNQ